MKIFVLETAIIEWFGLDGSPTLPAVGRHLPIGQVAQSPFQPDFQGWGIRSFPGQPVKDDDLKKQSYFLILLSLSDSVSNCIVPIFKLLQSLRKTNVLQQYIVFNHDWVSHSHVICAIMFSRLESLLDLHNLEKSISNS